MQEFSAMVEVMHKLRNECPWDKEQSLETLKTYLIEEAYECLEAMENYSKSKDPKHLIEELGDVLLQVLFQSEILTEKLGRPVIKDVIVGLQEKLIRRHPHIWGESNAKDSAGVLAQWDEIKKKEKGSAGKNESRLDGISKHLPALQKARKLGERAHKAKFDWTTMEEVEKDFESEVQEWREATTKADRESELGDILFCVAQMARHEGYDPEVALAGANQRFEQRFRKMEEFCQIDNRPWDSLKREDKEELWKRAKKSL